jgi:hypothetical protein
VPSPNNEEQEGFIVTPHGSVAFDSTQPNIARVYDYWLGGKDNFAADRGEAERLLAIYPRLRECAQENRQFLERAVAWLAEQGVRQFLDIGSGLPTARNTHEVAQAVDSACRVVYVDKDSVVLTHARALLRDAGVAAVAGDLTDPNAILASSDVCSQIRLDEPVGLILGLVLHFFDADNAREIATAFTHAIAPGSYVVISVGSADEETGGQLAKEYAAGTLHNHSPAQIAGFFTGLDFVGPGLADAGDWEPGLLARPHDHHGGRILAGVGLKP